MAEYETTSDNITTTTIQLLGRVIVVICQIALESWNVRQTV